MLSEDGQLVRRARQGRNGAFRQLVERHHGPVFALAYGMLGHRQDAEDVVQETFLRAYRSLGTFDVTRPLKAWLMKIASNCCRDDLSRRGRRPWLSHAMDALPSQGNGDPPGELSEEVERAVAELRPEYRTAFLLYQGQGFSYDEIAAMLGKPVGTIRTWLHRARGELLQALVRRGAVHVEDTHGL